MLVYTNENYLDSVALEAPIDSEGVRIQKGLCGIPPIMLSVRALKASVHRGMRRHINSSKGVTDDMELT